MGGVRRKMPPPTEAPKQSPDVPRVALLARLDGMFGAELDHLGTLRGAVAKSIAEQGLTPAMIRESTAISRALAAISAEARAREVHEKKMADGMSGDEKLALIVEFIRDLPAHEREDILAELESLKGHESVL